MPADTFSDWLHGAPPPALVAASGPELVLAPGPAPSLAVAGARR